MSFQQHEACSERADGGLGPLCNRSINRLPSRPRSASSSCPSSEAAGDQNTGSYALNSFARSPLYKTELCRSWEETGTCRYGRKCQFAHGVDELVPVQRHPKYKTQLCRTYAHEGYCPYGSRCRFIHAPSVPSKAASPGKGGQLTAPMRHSAESVSSGADTSTTPVTPALYGFSTQGHARSPSLVSPKTPHLQPPYTGPASLRPISAQSMVPTRLSESEAFDLSSDMRISSEPGSLTSPSLHTAFGASMAEPSWSPWSHRKRPHMELSPPLPNSRLFKMPHNDDSGLSANPKALGDIQANSMQGLTLCAPADDDMAHAPPFPCDDSLSFACSEKLQICSGSRKQSRLEKYFQN